MNFDAELKQLESVRSSLADNPTLTISQNKSLSTIIDLIQEDHVQFEKHSQSTRSRRKAARALLATVQRRLGNAILFLCSTVFSISKLNEINRRADDFVPELQRWKDTIQITDGIVELAQLHFTRSRLSRLVPDADQRKSTQHKRVVCFGSSSAKRLRTDSSTSKHGATPSYHGVLDLAASQKPAETPTDNNSDGSEGDDSDGSEDGDESDSGGAQAMANPRSTPEDDVPLYSNVFELTGMDAIRVIANQEIITCRLTVPHLPDSMPFITVNCPRSSAMHFVTRRNTIKW
ncbi:hypothetical protein NCS52_01566800 [Fusarium sp. LHS14.1]|nr:hypothetical protein NCS52_01566800 [Fusarium sp. LHS14.1]